MSFLQLFVTAPSSPLNCVSNSVPPFFDFTLDYSYFHLNSSKLSYHLCPARNPNSSSASFSFFKRNPYRALLFTVDVRETSVIDSSGKQILSSSIDTAQNLDDEDNKEQQRRKKIGLANKGRAPWNKGRKHSKETCERIKQRTIEALKDPKVRKKMASHPRPQSDQIKDKISHALRCNWAKRLKLKRDAEKFFSAWAGSIALAAKKGGKVEKELDWDSYDKIRKKIKTQQLQLDTEKVKAKEKAKEMAKEMAKRRAEIAAKTKADRKARLSAKREELRKKEKARKTITRDGRKSKDGVKELKVKDRLKLKQRLTKIRKKKSMNGQAASSLGNLAISQMTAWEKLDLEVISKDKAWKRASLADQIQMAKNSKAESMATKFIGKHTQTVKDHTELKFLPPATTEDVGFLQTRSCCF